MFILVQEALLIAIRGDEQLRGVRIVTRKGEGEEEVRERCLADDTVVYLKNAAQTKRLFYICDCESPERFRSEFRKTRR